MNLQEQSGLFSNIDRQIALLEEMGEPVGASYYETQKSLAEKQMETLTEKKNGLADALEQALSSVLPLGENFISTGNESLQHGFAISGKVKSKLH